MLDEAHYIKGRTIQTARAVYYLESDSRWCVSGTPIQNKLDDLFSLLHFLRIEPWSDYIWWNNYINKPFEKKDPIVFEIIQHILKPILLRRTKNSKNREGKPIVILPPKDSQICYIQMSAVEKSLYDDVHFKSRRELDDLLSKGALMSNYIHFFAILTKLRQICDHPFLLLSKSDYTDKNLLEQSLIKFLQKRKKKEESRKEDDYPEIYLDENNEVVVREEKEKVVEKVEEIEIDVKTGSYFNEIVSKIKSDTLGPCTICLSDLEDAVITVCLHIACRLCMARSLELTGHCHLCRKPLKNEDLMTLPREHRLGLDLKEKWVLINLQPNFFYFNQKPLASFVILIFY